MLTRRTLLALSGALLAVLCGCSGEAVDPEPAEPEPTPADQTASVRFPASFLNLCALSQDDVLEQYADGASEDALDAVAEGDDSSSPSRRSRSRRRSRSGRGSSRTRPRRSSSVTAPTPSR